MQKTKCCLCGSNQYEFLCRINLVGRFDSEVVKCRECGLMFVNPTLGLEELNEIYSETYFYSNDPKLGFQNYFSNRRSQYIQGKIIAGKLKRIRQTGKVLDVGCATGFLLEGIRQHCQWQVYGVEISAWAANYAKEKMNLDVYHGTLQQSPWHEGFFDVILLNDILEHTINPSEFLEAVRDKLIPGGWVFLWLPNGKCDIMPFIQDYRSGKVRVQTQAHLYYFDTGLIQKMFRQKGFVIESLYTVGLKSGLKDVGIWKRKEQRFPDRLNLQPITAQERIKPRQRALVTWDFLYEWGMRMKNLIRLPVFFPYGHEMRVIARKIGQAA